MGKPWTRDAVLPGGDMEFDLGRWESGMAWRYPFVEASVVRRLSHLYGTRVHSVLEGVSSAAGMGRDFGAGLHQREVDWLVDNEWAETAEDILWRRTKLGLHFSAAETEALDSYLAGRAGRD
jgi:glycerol-3-phosphate dehydrogenase